MPRRYSDIYPHAPLLSSAVFASQPASSLMTMNHFQAPPAAMNEEVFSEHHVLMNLHEGPMRVQNARDGRLIDLTVKKFDVFVTPAGIKSGWRWFETSDVIVATLDPKGVAIFAERQLGIVLSTQQLQSIVKTADEDICTAALMVCNTLETDDLASAVLFEALARVFLVKLLQRYADTLEVGIHRRGRFTTHHYRAVLDYVRTNLSRSIVLRDLATVVGMSPSSFAKKFKDTRGLSPMQFVMSYRVEQAAELLADPAVQLNEISYACGFADQAHFSRNFKQRTGMTPSDYRANLPL